MFKYILLFILIFVAYRFVFRLVIPMYNTTKHFKKKVDEMKRGMDLQQQQYEKMKEQQSVKEERKGDYIDFEEVKE